MQNEKRYGLWTTFVMVFVAAVFLSTHLPKWLKKQEMRERQAAAVLEHNAKNCFVVSMDGARFGPVIRMETIVRTVHVDGANGYTDRRDVMDTVVTLVGGAQTTVQVRETQGCK